MTTRNAKADKVLFQGRLQPGDEFTIAPTAGPGRAQQRHQHLGRAACSRPSPHQLLAAHRPGHGRRRFRDRLGPQQRQRPDVPAGRLRASARLRDRVPRPRDQVGDHQRRRPGPRDRAHHCLLARGQRRPGRGQARRRHDPQGQFRPLLGDDRLGLGRRREQAHDQAR